MKKNSNNSRKRSRRARLVPSSVPKTRVVNLYKEPFDVYIGRPSIWGNPFVLGIDGDREEVLRKYAEYMRGRGDLIAKARRELRGKVLGCYCSPQLCHGELLAVLADSGTPKPGRKRLVCSPIMVDELIVYPNAWGPFLKGSCHMTCRNLERLHRFAQLIGLKREWFQDRNRLGAPYPPALCHYDLTPKKRVEALKMGAVFVPAREQAERRQYGG